jgi:hypothetical protein
MKERSNLLGIWTISPRAFKEFYSNLLEYICIYRIFPESISPCRNLVYYGERMIIRRAVEFIVLSIFILSSVNIVFADVFIESQGPGGYGWQQLFYNTTSPYNFYRLTASADRQYYDYGYKSIQIYARQEDYWSQDSGWWYVTNPTISSIKIYDNGSGLVYSKTSGFTVTNATVYITYNWGTNISGTEKPGTWTVNVSDGTQTATFYIFVRGQLNVTSITTSASPTANSPVTVYATIKDARSGIEVTSGITPVLYVTGGTGYTYSTTMSYSGGYWNAQFTPPSPGDYKIIVKASDGHNKWVDGRGSKDISVGGAFPASMIGGNSLLRLAILIALILGFGVNNSVRRRFLYLLKERRGK